MARNLPQFHRKPKVAARAVARTRQMPDLRPVVLFAALVLAAFLFG